MANCLESSFGTDLQEASQAEEDLYWPNLTDIFRDLEEPEKPVKAQHRPPPRKFYSRSCKKEKGVDIFLRDENERSDL